MKLTEFKKLIREEIRKVLREDKGYFQNFKNYQKLFNAIDKLPDTIVSINVPIEASAPFGSGAKTKTISTKNNPKWRNQVKMLVRKVVSGEKIHNYNLRSTGRSIEAGPYEISITTESDHDFNQRMLAGEFGPLD